MEDMIDKFLDKIPSKEVYEDIFRPGMRKAGEALETVIDGANLILLPLKLLNSKSRVYFKNNIEIYEKKLNDNPELKLIQVPQYVGLPIIDKLTYLNQKELAEVFINLLTKASFDETLNLVHPGYISILNNLSADEAKILFHFKNSQRIPFIDIYLHRYVEKIKKPDYLESKGPKTREQLKVILNYQTQNREDTHIKAAWNLTGIEKYVDLTFPENIDIYIENLERNGLIVFERTLYSKIDDPIYVDLTENIYKKTVKEIEDGIKEETQVVREIEYLFEMKIKKGHILFSEFGKGFLKACINEIKENET